MEYKNIQKREVSNMIRVTIAVPEEFRPIAAELAGALGLSEADRNTFEPGFSLLTEDSEHTSYRVASGIVSSDWPTRAQSPLVEQDWPVDLVAATAAQSLLRINETPTSDIIAVDLSGTDTATVLQNWGLVPVSEKRLK
jgi:hypothetical protein